MILFRFNLRQEKTRWNELQVEYDNHIASLQQQVHTASVRRADAEDRHKDVVEHVRDLERDYDNLRRSSTVVNSEYNDLQADRDVLQEKLDSVSSQHNELREEYESAVLSNNELQKSILDLENQNKSLEQQYAGCVAKVRTLEKNCFDLKNQLSEGSYHMRDAQRERHELGQYSEQLQGDLDSLNSQYERAEAERERIENDCTVLSQENNRLQGELNSATGALARAQEQLSATTLFRSEHKSLKEKADTLESTLKDLERRRTTEFDEQAARVKDLKEDLVEARAEVTRLQSVAARLESNLHVSKSNEESYKALLGREHQRSAILSRDLVNSSRRRHAPVEIAGTPSSSPIEYPISVSDDEDFGRDDAVTALQRQIQNDARDRSDALRSIRMDGPTWVNSFGAGISESLRRAQAVLSTPVRPMSAPSASVEAQAGAIFNDLPIQETDICLSVPLPATDVTPDSDNLVRELATSLSLKRRICDQSQILNHALEVLRACADSAERRQGRMESTVKKYKRSKKEVAVLKLRVAEYDLQVDSLTTDLAKRTSGAR